MKIALCFLSRNELFNQQIWQKYLCTDLFNIYICPDVGYQLKYFPNFQIQCPYTKNKGNKILAIWYMLSIAIKDNNYKYLLLSDDCCPLTEPIELYNYCMSHELSNIRYLDSWVNKGHPRWITELKDSDQKANGDWWVLNHSHAQILVNSYDQIKTIYSRYSDDSEHAISCILHQHGQLNSSYVINMDIMYENYDFIIGGGNYTTMCNEQLDKVKSFLKNKQYYFFRKFYPTEHKNLNHINYEYWQGALSR